MSIVHVHPLESQKISVPLGETPLPFLPFGLLVKCLEESAEGENHNDGQSIGRNTREHLSPRALCRSDVAQVTERADRNDGHSSLRGWTRNVELIHVRKVMQAAKDYAINNLAKTRCEPSIKAGNRYHLHEMYRAAMFMVADATTNSTSPVHKEVIMWEGLSPVASVSMVRCEFVVSL